jgi:hypothetical protein
MYTARIKCYREYDGSLDAAYVRRLLDEERLMKNGESDGFRLQLDFRWYVELRKEDGPRVAPFKYAIEAYCLDNIQSFSRRYVSMEKALLHCLNGFNENAAIPNRYKSIQDYLSMHSCAQSHPNRAFRLRNCICFREDVIIAPQMGIRYALHIGVVFCFGGKFDVLNCTAVVHQPFG